jgi:sugar O-acyltransferase (sialic acid O-acetyltransferase NeuD family)
MKDIAIYGAGGYGRETACLLNRINKVSPQWKLIGFIDDGLPVGYDTGYGKVLGGLSEINQYPKQLSIVMAFANSQTLKKVVEQVTNPLIDFPNIIYTDVSFADQNSLQIGIGNIIGSRCGFSCNIKIGNFNRFNFDVHFGHDDVIGNFNMFNSSVCISGEVTIGDCNFFGVGSVVLQQKSVGNHVTIGANSVIIRKSKDYKTYVGNPAVELKY